MTGTNNITFWDEAVRAFAFLISRFGFDRPGRTHMGAEWAVEYSKGPGRIRVVMVAGAAPIVEIVDPAGETGPAQAGDPGISRSSPDQGHVGLRTIVSDADWPTDMAEYLNALGRELSQSEQEFLSRVAYADLAAALCAELQPILRAELAAGNVIENAAVRAYELCKLEVILRKPLSLSHGGDAAFAGLTVHYSGDPHYPVGTSISCSLHEHALTGLESSGERPVQPKIDG